jgi:hypothetical protein
MLRMLHRFGTSRSSPQVTKKIPCCTHRLRNQTQAAVSTDPVVMEMVELELELVVGSEMAHCRLAVLVRI